MTRKGIPTLGEAFPTVKGKCSNCKKPLPKYRHRWCSDYCSVDAYIKTDSGAMRNAVYHRDKGVCAICGWDTEKFIRAMNEAFDIIGRNTTEAVYFAEWLHEKFPCVSTFHGHIWKSLWEGDHIQPLIEGGKHVLENMRTACLVCHKAETKKLAVRRAAKRKSGSPRKKLTKRPKFGRMKK